MKVETAAAIVSIGCFVNSICLTVTISFARYFVGYSAELNLDGSLRMLLVLATSSFVAGIVVLIMLIGFIVTKRLGSHAKTN